MKGKKFWCKVQICGGQIETLAIKCNTEAEARDKLHKGYRIESILKISDTYMGEKYSPSYYHSGVVKHNQRNMRKTSGKLV